MADSTYTTGRNMLLQWIRKLNGPNSSPASSKSLDADVVDVVAIMRALGMKLVSYERTGEVLQTGCRVVIGSTRSGVKYIMEKKTSHCSCPKQNPESPFWIVSGIGSKETLAEADSSVFPKMSSGLNQVLHDTLIDILHVIREVELKPKKKRNFMICSQEVHSAGISPNTSGIRHAVSMPAIRSSPATLEYTMENYPVNYQSSVVSVPNSYGHVKRPAIDSTEKVVEQLEYIKNEMELLLLDLKPKCSTRIPSQVLQKVASGNTKDYGDNNKGAIRKRPTPNLTRPSKIQKPKIPARTAISSVRTQTNQKLENTKEDSAGDRKRAVKKKTNG